MFFSLTKNNLPKLVLLEIGSFNPITILHLGVLEETKNKINQKYNVIGAIISPVHNNYCNIKKSLCVSGYHRVEMCKLATHDSNWIGVSDWEISQVKNFFNFFFV